RGGELVLWFLRIFLVKQWSRYLKLAFIERHPCSLEILKFVMNDRTLKKKFVNTCGYSMLWYFCKSKSFK
ncbi:unnamed protein product, partial [Musa textilis]